MDVKQKVKNILTAIFVDPLRTGEDLTEKQRIQILLKRIKDPNNNNVQMHQQSAGPR